jgi:hypothetical protein
LNFRDEIAPTSVGRKYQVRQHASRRNNGSGSAVASGALASLANLRALASLQVVLGERPRQQGQRPCVEVAQLAGDGVEREARIGEFV